MKPQDLQKENMAWALIAFGFSIILYGFDHVIKYCPEPLSVVTEIIIGTITMITGFIIVMMMIGYLRALYRLRRK